MWHLRDFQRFLCEKYGEDVWNRFMYEDVKKIVVSSILTVGRLGRAKNSFELLGFDLMVDEKLKCWLIEINTSPAMDYSTV
jgi:D-alanine-D-alanine ligase-like ATP-grasp enzyme